MSRKRVLPPLLGCALFVALCVWLALDDVAVAARGAMGIMWFGVAFFGLGIVLFGLELVRPSRLSLTSEGFTSQSPGRRSRFVAWTKCGPFTVARYWSSDFNIFEVLPRRVTHRVFRPVELVRFDAGGDPANRRRRMGNLRAGFDNLNGNSLAALMNQYRDKFGGAE